MLEICFAIVLGFGLTTMSGAALAENLRVDRILTRSLIALVLLTFISLGPDQGMSLRGTILYLLSQSFVTHTVWLLLGACLAIFIQLFEEGHLETLWVKFSPHTAPTPEAHAGQRSHSQGFGTKQAVPATLVGTSTQYLTQELDLRTETLIRLAFYAFEDKGPRIVTYLESALRLGTGKKQKAFLKIAANSRSRPNPKRLVHRYWRSVNGNTRMGQSLLGELCQLANMTQNLDAKTISRIKKVGTALKLTPNEMTQALSFMR